MQGRGAAGRGVVLSVLAGALAFGCLVQDVELVDTLPGEGNGAVGNTSGAGSPSHAGNSSSSDGGEDAAAGDGSGGSKPSAGSAAGGQAGAMSPGGSGGANPGGSAGSAGMNQGGSNDPGAIPDLQSCPDPLYILCDNFETGADSQWSTTPTPEQITDAPSGQYVLESDFVPERLQLTFTSLKVSFWVRIQTEADQPILSFFSNNQDKIRLGLEESRLRWTYWSGAAQSTGNVRIPQNNAASRLLPIGSWFCLELAISANPKSLDARVVIPGDATGPFAMPTVDGNPTAGIDDQWNMSYNWGVNGNAGLFFGDDGAYQEFDDVMVGAFDQKTLCELYEETL